MKKIRCFFYVRCYTLLTRLETLLQQPFGQQCDILAFYHLHMYEGPEPRQYAKIQLAGYAMPGIHLINVIKLFGYSKLTVCYLLRHGLRRKRRVSKVQIS